MDDLDGSNVEQGGGGDGLAVAIVVLVIVTTNTNRSNPRKLDAFESGTRSFGMSVSFGVWPGALNLPICYVLLLLFWSYPFGFRSK